MLRHTRKERIDRRGGRCRWICLRCLDSDLRGGRRRMVASDEHQEQTRQRSARVHAPALR
jgi:hypothetical protein